MVGNRTVVIDGGICPRAELTLTYDHGRWVTHLSINGVLYHFEQMTREEFGNYVVDSDPDFEPMLDKDGMCYLIAPFCK
jgi:hypothetical protein